MSSLVAALIDHFETGTETEAVALRALLDTGSMVADFDLANVAEPYVIVIEGRTTLMETTTNYTTRLERTPVSFRVFADSRESAEAIAEALDNCYQTKVLSVSNRTIPERPEFQERTPSWKVDNWQQEITFVYTLEKRFPRS